MYFSLKPFSFKGPFKTMYSYVKRKKRVPESQNNAIYPNLFLACQGSHIAYHVPGPELGWGLQESFAVRLTAGTYPIHWYQWLMATLHVSLCSTEPTIRLIVKDNMMPLAHSPFVSYFGRPLSARI